MGVYVGLALEAAREMKNKKNRADRIANINAQFKNIPWYRKYLIDPIISSQPIIGDWWVEHKEQHLADLQAKARNSTGVAGESELKKAANSTREIMNQQLNNNISTINQNWGTRGRYGSGARTQAILQAQNSANFNLANVVNQMSLQESQFQRNLDEQHARFQASLDANAPSIADKIGDIVNIGTSIYASNPGYFNEKLGGMGEKFGIGGASSNMYAAPTKELSLPDISNMNVNPQNQPYGPYDNEIQTKTAPSFLVPPQQSAEKPVSQWVEEDFFSSANSLPKDNVEFFSSPDNIKTFSNSLNYVISNNLDDGELAQIALEYSLTGDIGKVIEWLLEKGVVLDGSSSIQSK